MFSGIKKQWLVLVVIAALAAFLVACDTGESSDSAPNSTIIPGNVESLTITSTRSIPEQHLVNMTIVLNNGCEEFNAVDWVIEEDDKHVHFELTIKIPSEPTDCTLAISYEDHSINIGSDFESGAEYTVTVNGFTLGSFVGG